MYHGCGARYPYQMIPIRIIVFYSNCSTIILIYSTAHCPRWDRTMEKASVMQEDILKSTLFHIQMKRCQYIDDFPETVASIFSSMCVGKRLKPYDDMKRKLYRINTNFFDINNKIKKRDFYLGLYERIQRKIKN